MGVMDSDRCIKVSGLLGSIVFGQTLLAETTACRKCTAALKAHTSLAANLPEVYISAEGPHFTVPFSRS